MRWLFALVLGSALGAGCGFSVAGGAADDDTRDASIDGPMRDGSEAVTRRCDIDNSLRLCLDFEDMSAMFTDGSGRSHDATGQNILAMSRDSEQAALLATDSRLYVPETPDLDIATTLTISMWMKIATAVLPQSGSTGRWLLDNNNQYFMSVREFGKLRCGAGTFTLDTIPGLVGWTDEDWHHVGCTFDGATFAIYVDGNRVACKPSTKALSADGVDGLAIGANLGAGATYTEMYAGGLDNIQIFARTKSPDEMCMAAGRADCMDFCP